MTMPRTTAIKGTVVSFLCVVTLGTALFLSSGQKQTSIIQSTAFVPKQSLVVGSTVSLATQVQDMRGKTVTLAGRKILVFSDKSCGSCLYLTFPIIEWVQKFKDTRFYYIEKTDQVPLIDGELRSYQNFHIISNSNSHISQSFGEPSTPSVFFLDADNKVVWKNTGFVMTDYARYEQRIKEFSEGRSTFDDYQENINVGKPFPKIAHNSNGVTVLLPDDSLGKPTLMFFLFSSSKSSKDILDDIPSSITDDANINKVFVFAGITDETVKRNVDFAKHFALREVEFEAQQSFSSSRVDLTYVLNRTKSFKSTTVIEDDLFEISNRIALVGGPYMCILDAEGDVLSINGVRLNTPEEYADLFKECAKILQWKGGDNT